MKRTPWTSVPSVVKPVPRHPNVALARALSKLGAASRAVAERMIRAGAVTVNGRAVTNPKVRVHPGRDRIAVHGDVVTRESRRYIMMNKPAGYVTTRSDERGRRTVYDLLGRQDSWIFPVGRLDRDTRGLLLFTNDTRWADALTDPASKTDKAYEARLDRAMSDADMERLRRGVTLDDGYHTRPARVRRLHLPQDHRIEIVITEGKNRQVRRMAAALGYEIRELIRKRIGPVSCSDLREGETRPLTPSEIRALA